jgi:UPF0288 family protein (methanogenesis marker protein 3)
METTTKKHPFYSAQIKEMVDRLKGSRLRNLARYHEAARNTEFARDTLISLIRDDEKHVFVYCQIRFESRVQSGIEFLQEMRHREKETLEFYVDTKEKAIAARRMQRDKEMEEHGGSSEEKMKRMKYVPPALYRVGNYI